MLEKYREYWASEGDELLLSKEEALELIEECDKAEIQILGVELVFYDGVHTYATTTSLRYLREEGYKVAVEHAGKFFLEEFDEVADSLRRQDPRLRLVAAVRCCAIFVLDL